MKLGTSQRFLYLVACCVVGLGFSPSGFAGILTLPSSSFTAAEGNSRVTVPFDGLGHLQALYGSSMFPGSRLSITGLQVRADGGQWPFGTYGNGNVTIDLSSTTKTAGQLSSTFSSNNGADRTTVFNGAVNMTYGSGSNPNPFGSVVNFSAPYTYDPQTGKSLVVNIVARDFVGTASGGFDADRQTGVAGAGLVLALDPNAATGFYVGTSDALILNLQYSVLTDILSGNPAAITKEDVSIDFSSITNGGVLSVSHDLLNPSSLLLPGDFVVPGSVLQSWKLGFDNSAINGPVSLTFHYDQSLLGGTNERDLRILHVYSDGSGSQILTPVINDSLNTLTVTVDRFSTFSVIAAADTAVPEPASLVLWCIGFLGCTAVGYRKQTLLK